MTAANAISEALSFFPHMAGTASSVFGVFQFGLGGLSGWAVVFAGDGSPLPMAVTILVCGILSLTTRHLLTRPHGGSASGSNIH